MEKVKLTKGQADALRSLLAAFCENKEQTIFRHAQFLMGEKYPKSYKALETVTLQELCDAVYHGYEVEMTSEEKVRELFERLNDELANAEGNSQTWYVPSLEGQIKGMRKTLDALGIKIEGVND